MCWRWGAAVTGSKWWVQGGGCLASVHPCTLQATSLATAYTSPCPPSYVLSYANTMPVKCWMRSEIWAFHSTVEWTGQTTGWQMHWFEVFPLNEATFNWNTMFKCQCHNLAPSFLLTYVILIPNIFRKKENWTWTDQKGGKKKENQEKVERDRERQ